jgi:hypothetical protein
MLIVSIAPPETWIFHSVEMISAEWKISRLTPPGKRAALCSGRCWGDFGEFGQFIKNN